MEEWKDIPDTDGTMQVSDLGRVRSRRRGNGRPLPEGEWRICKLSPHSKGYLTVQVEYPSGSSRQLVQCLVLEAFVGPCPDGYQAAHYPDPTKTNNRLDNLRWATPEENAQDKVLQCRGNTQTLTPATALAIRNQVLGKPLDGELLASVRQQFPEATVSMIHNIRYGKTWKCLATRSTH